MDFQTHLDSKLKTLKSAASDFRRRGEFLNQKSQLSVRMGRCYDTNRAAELALGKVYMALRNKDYDLAQKELATASQAVTEARDAWLEFRAVAGHLRVLKQRIKGLIKSLESFTGKEEAFARMEYDTWDFGACLVRIWKNYVKCYGGYLQEREKDLKDYTRKLAKRKRKKDRSAAKPD